VDEGSPMEDKSERNRDDLLKAQYAVDNFRRRRNSCGSSAGSLHRRYAMGARITGIETAWIAGGSRPEREW